MEISAWLSNLLFRIVAVSWIYFSLKKKKKYKFECPLGTDHKFPVWVWTGTEKF